MEISNRKLFSRGMTAIGFAVAFSGVLGGTLAAEQPEAPATVATSGAENHELSAQEEASRPVACSPDSGSCIELSAQEEALRSARFEEQDRRLDKARFAEKVTALRAVFEEKVTALRAAIAKLANPEERDQLKDEETSMSWGELANSKERDRLLKELEALKLSRGNEVLDQARQAADREWYPEAVQLATEALESSRPEKQLDGSQGDSPLLTKVNAFIEFCRIKQPSSVTVAPQKSETQEDALDGVIAELSDPKKNFGTLGEERRRLFQREREALRLANGKKLLDQARQAAADERYPDAIQLATQALEVSKPKKSDGSLGDGDSPLLAEVGTFTEFCRTRQHALESRQATSVANSHPQHEANEAKVKQLLAEARVFYQARRYQEAISRVEEIYLIDPFQRDAIQMMNDIYKKVYSAGLHRREADVAGILTSDMWQWVEPVFPVSVQPGLREGVRKESTEQETLAKMERIVIPRFEFENVDVKTVVNYLNNVSEKNDPAKEGVNISYIADQSSANPPRVSMKLSKIPLSDLIRYICQSTGLKYRVGESGITIGTNVDEIQRRDFSVRGELISSITGSDNPDMQEAGAPAEAGGGAPAETGEGGGEASKQFLNRSAAGKSAVSSTALIDYFSARGVPFGPGSSISYNKSAGKLIVRNTLDNLRRFDELIRQLDAIQTPLVMVEIKGIEISETNMQELGFDWSMDVVTRNMTTDQDGNNVFLEEGADNGWAFGQGHNRSLNTRGMTSNASLWGVNTAVINKLNVFPAIFGRQSIFGSDVPFNLYLTINALSQNAKTETLSAPKVMTLSGNKASVHMVKSYWFPTEWDEYDIDDDDNGVSIDVPTPDFEEFDDIGITFEVTPVVNPDNYTITLDVNPVIRNFIGKDEYPIVVTGEITQFTNAADENGIPIPGQMTLTRSEESMSFNVWMPIISSRRLHVNVTVYDGETIVLGGMIDSSVNKRTDKWPLLGDLPFIGRFFTSQAEDTVRNNLLLFVTTRLVNNDGIPIRRGQQSGAPDFNR